ncbi:hypothetical protein E3P99_04128, partial [Wallemia hederae]
MHFNSAKAITVLAFTGAIASVAASPASTNDVTRRGDDKKDVDYKDYKEDDKKGVDYGKYGKDDKHYGYKDDKKGVDYGKYGKDDKHYGYKDDKKG